MIQMGNTAYDRLELALFVHLSVDAAFTLIINLNESKGGFFDCFPHLRALPCSHVACEFLFSFI